MYNSCCKVDSICHMDNYGYCSIMEKIINSSTENSHCCIWILIAIIVLLFILLGIILCLFCNMANKYRKDQDLVFSEFSNLNQSIKKSIESSIRNTFDGYYRKNSKCDEWQCSHNESLIKLYFLINVILSNIKSCRNNMNNKMGDFMNDYFKFQSNHIKIIAFPHSTCFSYYTNIDELLGQFEEIAKKVILDYNNPHKQKYEEKIDEIEKKINNYMIMIKELLNLKTI